MSKTWSDILGWLGCASPIQCGWDVIQCSCSLFRSHRICVQPGSGVTGELERICGEHTMPSIWQVTLFQVLCFVEALANWLNDWGLRSQSRQRVNNGAVFIRNSPDGAFDNQGQTLMTLGIDLACEGAHNLTRAPAKIQHTSVRKISLIYIGLGIP